MKKKALLIALAIAFGVSALTFSNIDKHQNTISIALAGDEPEEDIFAAEREEARIAVCEMVDVNEYQGEARVELEAKITEILNRIDQAKEPYEFDQIVNDFFVYLDWYFFEKYYPPLSRFKDDKKCEVEYFSEFFSYDSTYQYILDEKMEEALLKIDDATSKEEIERICEEYFYYVEFVFVRTYRVFDELKQEAIDYINWTLTQLDNYDEKLQKEISLSAKYAKEFINLATTNGEIYKEYDDYKDYFENLPTLAEQELERVREELIRLMYIACDIGERQLRNSDIDIFHVYYDWTIVDIENGTNVNDLYQYYEGFLDAVKDYIPDIREQIEIAKGLNGSNPPCDEDGEKSNKNTGLIVACSVEGAVILLGGVAIGLYFLINKKRKTSIK